MAQYTLTHSEQSKGWTSFFSFIPDWFSRLDNRLYTIKNGQLWIHNDEDNAVHNNFYNSQYSSSVKTVFNDGIPADKIYKTMVLESDQKWGVALNTNYTEGTIAATEFNTRESRQFTFLRGSEEGTTRGNAAQGIGTITANAGLTVTFTVRLADLISIGDTLVQLNGSTQETIGVITAINRTTNVVTVGSVVTTPVNGYFAFAKKNARVEGEEIRGVYMEATFTNTETTDGELYAVSTEIAKSYV